MIKAEVISAIQKEDFQALTYILEEYKLQYEELKQSGSIETIEHPFDPESEKTEELPLTYAQTPEMIEFLVKNGANINRKYYDTDGNEKFVLYYFYDVLCLFECNVGIHIKLVVSVLKLGANPDIMDRNNIPYIYEIVELVNDNIIYDIYKKDIEMLLNALRDAGVDFNIHVNFNGKEKNLISPIIENFYRINIENTSDFYKFCNNDPDIRNKRMKIGFEAILNTIILLCENGLTYITDENLKYIEDIIKIIDQKRENDPIFSKKVYNKFIEDIDIAKAIYLDNSIFGFKKRVTNFLDQTSKDIKIYFCNSEDIAKVI